MKFYGQHELDKILYERYFKDFKGKGVCLECGAADGHNISTTRFFEETLGWQSINIEPHTESFKRLVVNRPNATNINFALSDTDGDAHLVTGRNFYLRAYLVKDERKNTIPIKKATYKDIVDNIPVDHIDLMVLDVEGHEIAALNGMIGAKVLPYILCVEVNHSGKKQIRSLLEKMGYRFDSSITINDVFVKNK